MPSSSSTSFLSISCFSQPSHISAFSTYSIRCCLFSLLRYFRIEKKIELVAAKRFTGIRCRVIITRKLDVRRELLRGFFPNRKKAIRKWIRKIYSFIDTPKIETNEMNGKRRQPMHNGLVIAHAGNDGDNISWNRTSFGIRFIRNGRYA